ncbi:MAG: hypothetical protein WBZ29_04475 [Methanocella sp.]
MEMQVMRPEDVVTLWCYTLVKRDDGDSWYGHVAIFGGDRYTWIMAVIGTDTAGDLLANAGEYECELSEDVTEGLAYDMSERAVEHIDSAAREMLRDRRGNVTMLSDLSRLGDGTLPIQSHPLIPALESLHMNHGDRRVVTR